MELRTPPLAPSIIHALKQLNIHTIAELQQIGAVTTFLLLKASGLTITNSTLWQLEALCRHIATHSLTATDKASLLAAVKSHRPVALFPPESIMRTHMKAALNTAEQAAALGEIPVGAVVVHNNHIIAYAHNTCINSHDVSQHAEIQALSLAGKMRQNYRLDECDLYVTLEPCAMCASAIMQARIRRLIFATHEPKTGAAGSVIDLFANPMLNHHTAVLSGIEADAARTQLQQFFHQRRKKS